MNPVQRLWPLKTITAVIALLLQIIVAPYIAIEPAEPNFLAIAALAVAIALPEKASFGFSFGLGIAFDVFGGGPIGAMACCLLVVNALAIFAQRRLGNDTLFMNYVVLGVGLLLVEFFYGLLLLAFGFEATLGAVLLWRVLPCTLYNVVLGLAVLPILRHFSPQNTTTTGIPTAKVGVNGL